MPIYDINGNALQSAYDINGDAIQTAYDINGNAIPLQSPIESLKVMTFNVQGWTGINADVTLMQSIFTAHDPDIIGFQEGNIANAPSTLPAKANYTNYSGIASKTALSNVSETTYATQGHETRKYSKGYYPLPNGKQLAIFNTHIEVPSWSYEAFLAQHEELLTAALQEEYFVLLGDFNCSFKAKTDSQYEDVMPQYLEANCRMANWKDKIVFTWFGGTTVAGSGTNIEPCDNIITSSNVILSGVAFDQRKIDADANLTIDHIPVVAEILIY